MFNYADRSLLVNQFGTGFRPGDTVQVKDLGTPIGVVRGPHLGFHTLAEIDLNEEPGVVVAVEEVSVEGEHLLHAVTADFTRRNGDSVRLRLYGFELLFVPPF